MRFRDQHTFEFTPDERMVYDWFEYELDNGCSIAAAIARARYAAHLFRWDASDEFWAYLA